MIEDGTEGDRRDTNNLDQIHFQEFFVRLDVIDKFREKYLSEIRKAALSDRRVDLDLSETPILSHIKVMTTNFSLSAKLDKAKVRMSGYWKFNASRLDVKDFWDQIELMLRGNRWLT